MGNKIIRDKLLHVNKYTIFILTIGVNVIIPKAGIKVQGIPLTLGNVLLALSIIILFFWKKGKIDGSDISKWIMLSMTFWAIRIVPFVGKVGVNTLIGQITALVIYPLSFYVTKEYLKHEGIEKAERVIQIGVGIIIIYGILQFYVGIGRVDIPGITVNYSDYIDNPISWWEEKFNIIGSTSKTVSTYQNGNVFGCSLLLLFPIAFRAKFKNEIYRYGFFALYILTIVLTGSRSCMIGCLIYILLYLVKSIKNRKTKRRIVLSVIVMLVPCVILANRWLSNPNNAELVNRMFGMNIDLFVQGGGRTSKAVEYLQWMSKHPWAALIGGLGSDYSGSAYEMTYIAVCVMGGIIGLILFLVPFTKVIKRCHDEIKASKDPLLQGVAEGLTVYLLTAFFEGAYWLPPTAMNLWMVCAMGEYLLCRQAVVSRMNTLNSIERSKKQLYIKA